MENIILFIGMLALPSIAFTMISIAFGNHCEKIIKKKLSGFEVARKILDDNDLKDMYIVEVKGNLNDHYDYNQNVIRLSSDVYNGESISSAIIAAKVCSYAIQDKDNNSFMRFRSVVNPLATFAVYIGYILFIIGLCLQDFGMIKIAALLLLISIVFHLVTLPVEFDATKKAKANLDKSDILNKNEIEEGSDLFRAIPFMFVMTVLTCISNLINEIIYNLKRKG